jgi:hypothetical protein
MDFYHAYELRDSDAAVIDDPVDHMEPIEDERGGLADALVRIVAWQLTGPQVNKIGARAMVLATALGIGAKSMTWEDIARASGVTRSAVSLMAMELEDQFGLKSTNTRTERTRKRCKIAQKSLQK